MKRKVFTVTVDYQDLSSIESENIEAMMDFFMMYSMSAENFDICNYTVTESVDSQDVQEAIKP